jgi:hypothetical protein
VRVEQKERVPTAISLQASRWYQAMLANGKNIGNELCVEKDT